MTSTFGLVEEPASAIAGTARRTASELKNARRIDAFTVVKMLSAGLAAPEGVRHPREKVKVFLAAVVLALAAPAAAGAGLTFVSRDVRGAAPARVAHFDLVGIHWRGSGSVLFRTRKLAGRWSPWRAAAPRDDDLPDRGAEGRSGWRLGSPFWVGGADVLQARKVGRVGRVRAYFVRSPGRSRSVLQPLM